MEDGFNTQDISVVEDSFVENGKVIEGNIVSDGGGLLRQLTEE